MRLAFICIFVTLTLAVNLRVTPDDSKEEHLHITDPGYHWCGAPEPQDVPRTPPNLSNNKRDITSCPTCTWWQCELSSYFGEDPPICSDPAVRDQFSSTPNPALQLRVYIYVLRETSGANPIASNAHLTWFENHMNSAFLPAGIQFQFTRLYADDTTLRYQTVFKSQFNSFKTSVNNKVSSLPSESKALRIYIANLEGGLLGSATFAYEPDVLDVTGGFIMSYLGVRSTCGDVECITGPHEMGHCLGLYHTFQDGPSSAPSECRFCSWVLTQPSNKLDETGDFCSDTYWLPTVHDESDPDCYGGGDFCPIGDPDFSCTDYDCSGLTITIPHSIIEGHASNFMSYLGCSTKSFTAKQMARMRCFIDYYMQEVLATGGGGGVPPEWTCSDEWYTDSWCDCGCGAYDPTCDDPDAPLYISCDTDQLCSLNPNIGCYDNQVAIISKVKVPDAQIAQNQALVRWVMKSKLYPIDIFQIQKRIKKSGVWQSWTKVNMSVAGTKRKFLLKNLLSKRWYQVRIRSKNEVGTSPWKNSKQFKTL